MGILDKAKELKITLNVHQFFDKDKKASRVLRANPSPQNPGLI